RFLKISSVTSAAEDYLSAYDVRIQQFRKTVSKKDFKALAAADDSVDSSVSKRRLMIVMAWNRFKDTKIRGLGAGNSAVSNGGFFEKIQIHNFLLELLFEGGCIFFGFLVVWAALLLHKLLMVSRFANIFYKKLSSACMISSCGFVLSCLAVGTPIYQT